MNFKNKGKEFKLVPKTRKVIDLTKRLESKNLNDLIFTGFRNVDVEVLGEVIKAFAEYEDSTKTFETLDEVFDFIDTWKEENKKDYSDLFKVVIEITNEMGFFKKKMTKEELKQEMDSPVNINIQEMIQSSAQKMLDEMAKEEFQGFKG